MKRSRAETADLRLQADEAWPRRAPATMAKAGRDRNQLDQLAPFRPLVSAIRWGTLAVGFAVAVAESSDRTPIALGLGLVLGAYAMLRSFWPLTFRPGRRADLALVLVEVVLTASVVAATGQWSSPYFFCLITAIVATGFSGGSTVALSIAVATSLAVAIPFQLYATPADARLTFLGSSELLLVALVSGYARRMFGEAQARTTSALDRVQRLSEANQLLHELHRVALTLPASLDLAEVVGSVAQRLHELFSPDVVAVILWESGAWRVATARGVHLDPVLGPADLPAGPADAVDADRVVVLTEMADRGLSPASLSAIYTPLRARGALVGLLAVESSAARRFGSHHAELLAAMAEQAALAIDNAHWFARLRTVGADEERMRIARDLHDRLGQSLAYLAFELDRISVGAEGHAVHPDLLALRQDVRRVVSEMRETLYDLRTDVSETQDLVAVARSHLRRVEERTAVRVELHADARVRPPLRQERELWRIAQEAVTNAERHSQGHTITVTWRCDDVGALLEVADDGIGVTTGTRRPDSYGLLGMRERADAIGAILDIGTTPGGGTTVRCRLGADERMPAAGPRP